MLVGEMWISNRTKSQEIVNVVAGSKTCGEVHERLIAHGLDRIVGEDNFVNAEYFINVYYFDAMHQVSVAIHNNTSKRTAKSYQKLHAFNDKLASMTPLEWQA